MKENIVICEEHGGVFYSRFGRAEITFFAHQVSVNGDKVAITPNVLKFKATSEEKA